MRRHTLLLLLATSLLTVAIACGGDPAKEGGAGGTGGGGGLGGDGGGGGEGGPPTEAGAIPKASPRSFDSDTATAEFLATVAGDYTVAVYAAPKDEEVGPATLTAAFDGTSVSLSLKLGNGTVITTVSVEVEDRSCNDGRCVRWINPTATYGLPPGGKDVHLDDYYASTPEEASLKRSIRAAFLPDGFVTGSVGLNSDYRFRNHILAYGEAIPAVFESLAGSYSSVEEAVFCGENPLLIDIAREGTVRIQGKSNVSCAEKDITVAWNGNDDMLLPTDEGAELILDAARIGGSGGGGIVRLRLDTADEPGTFTSLRTEFGGAEGHIETRPDTVVKLGDD